MVISHLPVWTWKSLLAKASLDAIPKVATGALQISFADINSIIKFLDQKPGAFIIDVMMVYDKPPFAVIDRKSLGVNGPSDLEGSALGAPPPDGAWAQFPSFAKANGIDPIKITVEPVGFPTREPMLAEDKVGSITSFFILLNFSSLRRSRKRYFQYFNGRSWSEAILERYCR